MSPTPTRRKAWLMPLARRYVRRKLRRAFDGMFVEGLSDVRNAAQRAPLIIAANHVAWWDPLVALHVDALLGTEGHCLMDEDNLLRYPFFGWVGALPLASGATKRTLAHMRAAAQLLDRPGRALWIFPQGRQRPAHLRPLAPAPGVVWLSRASGASVVPLALDYQYREAPVPSILVSFGTPISAAAAPLLAQLEGAWMAGLGRIDAWAEAGALQSAAFTAALPARRSAERAIPLGGRLLARLHGGAAQRALGDGRESRG